MTACLITKLFSPLLAAILCMKDGGKKAASLPERQRTTNYEVRRNLDLMNNLTGSTKTIPFKRNNDNLLAAIPCRG